MGNSFREAWTSTAGPAVALTRKRRRPGVSSIGSFTNELEQLPDKYRLPLVYAALEELDYATIGAMLKVRPGTVKTLVFRGKLLLKERVDAVLDMKRQRERSNVG